MACYGHGGLAAPNLFCYISRAPAIADQSPNALGLLPAVDVYRAINHAPLALKEGEIIFDSCPLERHKVVMLCDAEYSVGAVGVAIPRPRAFIHPAHVKFLAQLHKEWLPGLVTNDIQNSGLSARLPPDVSVTVYETR